MSKPKIEHIMISYNTKTRDLCLKIKKELENSGQEVWMDVDKICGSSYESMAEAVEKSKCILMCFTESYRLSENCAMEAKYAKALNKPIVPLKMQLGYTPTGWLGFILGDKIFVDFSNPEKYPFDECMRRLFSQLNLLLNIKANYASKPIESSNSKTNEKKPTINVKEVKINEPVKTGDVPANPSIKQIKPNNKPKNDDEFVQDSTANNDEPVAVIKKPPKKNRSDNIRKPKIKSECTSILTKEIIKKILSDFDYTKNKQNYQHMSPGWVKIEMVAFDLSNKGYDWIDEDAFDEWNHIRYPTTDKDGKFMPIPFALNLSSNEIHELDKNVFEKLIHLKKLDLSNNQIQTWPEHVYDGCPKYIFDCLYDLTWLSLKNNFVSSFPWYIFSELANLKFLSLESNEIEELPDKIFDGLGNVEGLNLSHNKIAKLPVDAFNKCLNLRWLCLSHNNIPKIDDRTFYEVKNLRFLDLYQNQIKSLPKNLFYFSINLEWLDLNNNPIQDFPVDIFDRLTKIRRLGFFAKQQLINTLPSKVQNILIRLEGLRKDPELANEEI